MNFVHVEPTKKRNLTLAKGTEPFSLTARADAELAELRRRCAKSNAPKVILAKPEAPKDNVFSFHGHTAQNLFRQR